MDELVSSCSARDSRWVCLGGTFDKNFDFTADHRHVSFERDPLLEPDQPLESFLNDVLGDLVAHLCSGRTGTWRVLEGVGRVVPHLFYER
jgi:hypothetical protein